jgi:hypothetical protein
MVSLKFSLRIRQNHHFLAHHRLGVRVPLGEGGRGNGDSDGCAGKISDSVGKTGATEQHEKPQKPEQHAGKPGTKAQFNA